MVATHREPTPRGSCNIANILRMTAASGRETIHLTRQAWEEAPVNKAESPVTSRPLTSTNEDSPCQRIELPQAQESHPIDPTLRTTCEKVRIHSLLTANRRSAVQPDAAIDAVFNRCRTIPKKKLILAFWQRAGRDSIP